MYKKKNCITGAANKSWYCSDLQRIVLVSKEIRPKICELAWVKCAMQNRFLLQQSNEKRAGLKEVLFDRSRFRAIHAKIFRHIGADPILWEALMYSANPVSIIWICLLFANTARKIVDGIGNRLWATLLMAVRYLCRQSKRRWNLLRRLKIYNCADQPYILSWPMVISNSVNEFFVAV